jgi:hypothetical protein
MQISHLFHFCAGGGNPSNVVADLAALGLSGCIATKLQLQILSMGDILIYEQV